MSRGLQKFFKGRSAIEFYDLWERVFTLLGIAKDQQTLKAFRKQLSAEILRVRAGHKEVERQIVGDLQTHFMLSMAMAEAVWAEDIGSSDMVGGVLSEMLRRANLLRHHFGCRRPCIQALR